MGSTVHGIRGEGDAVMFHQEGTYTVTVGFCQYSELLGLKCRVKACVLGFHHR